MKKMVMVATISAMMVACNVDTKFGYGGSMAEKYVKEEVLRGHDDVKSVEVVKEDSLLCDVGLMFERKNAWRKKNDYFEGLISKDELKSYLDSCMDELSAISDSWKFGKKPDNMERYEGKMRRVYTVKVTTVYGKVREIRVLMDNDGVTPRTTEEEFLDNLVDYLDDFEIGNIV